MTPVCCRGSQGPEAVISLSLPALHFHSCGGVKGEFGTLEDIRPTLEGLSGRTSGRLSQSTLRSSQMPPADALRLPGLYGHVDLGSWDG